MKIMKQFIFILFLLPSLAYGEVVGSVSTVFKLLGANDKIIVEAFDDPKVEGVSCHLSRAKKGGIKGSIGLAEDPSNSSIACRQIGPIKYGDNLKEGEEVFTKNTSILLGDYFDNFINYQIKSGKYSSASEVVRDRKSVV